MVPLKNSNAILQTRKKTHLMTTYSWHNTESDESGREGLGAEFSQQCMNECALM